MRVGFGATRWVASGTVSGMDGIANYSRELNFQLNQYRPVPVVFGDGVSDDVGAEIYHLPHFSRVAFLNSVLRRPLRSDKLESIIDLFHATDHFVAKFSTVPVVATVHDAVPISHPQWVTPSFRALKNWFWRNGVQSARHIIAISEFSRNEIIKFFKVPEKRISVVFNGVDRRYFDRLGDDVLNRFHLPGQFFLFVGTLQPRKNLDRLLDAHESLPWKVRQEFPLLIVGNLGWGVDDLLRRLDDSKSQGVVRWLRGVDDLEKRAMMQRATALVLPSLYEGFGLPVLEGFASQVPVITSNLSALPEVASDAAWSVDPYSVAAIREAMLGLTQNYQLRRLLVARGLDRARMFTWEACARRTVGVYEDVLSSS